METEKTKYRHELKYLISSAQIPLLKARISQIMHSDPHAGSRGTYNIRSVYFDDYHNKCFFENENGTDPREKFRIRIYNHSAERISLECKEKNHGKTLKNSCPLTIDETRHLLERHPIPIQGTEYPLIRKLTLQMHTRLLRPVVIVEYDRTPYVYQNGNVRITFDSNICASACVKNFLTDSIPKRPVLPVGHALMEVKFDEYLPDFIYRSLNLGQLQQTTFSKYYLCRKFID